jgi:hypothetical protein
MTTLRTAFNDLVTSMKRYDLYQIDDEVGMGVQNLSDKIDEVYNRIACVINTNQDIRGKLSIYADVMSFDDSEILERSVNDINIAMDLTDNEPISVNWYGLFAPKNEEEIVPRETNISVDDVVKVAMELGMNTSIEEINEVMGYYNSESEQDPTATWELTVENLLYNCVVPSQQTIEDKVEHSGGGIPYRICNECVIKEEEDVMKFVDGVWLCNDCIPPTSQCRDTEVHGIVKEVIANLKDIQVDGETMDYIIKELGYEEYLLRSLVMNSSFKDTKDLLKEKILLSDKK